MHQFKQFEHPNFLTVARPWRIPLGRLFRKAGFACFVLCTLSVLASLALAQDNPPSQNSQAPSSQSQDVPDAPSAVKPPSQFPPNLPPAARPDSTSQGQPGDNAPPPMPPIKTTPPGTAPSSADNEGLPSSHEELYTLKTGVNFVVVPVTVKDDDGHMVDGLLPRDFTVLEDGKKQQLKFFSSDPIALSAAVILDLGMPDAAVQKVNQTFTALQGAFSPYDEVALYTFSTTVSQVSDFNTGAQRLTRILDQIKTEHGQNNGVPVMSGPLGPQGPTVNGIPVERQGAPANTSPPKDVSVLNDAILRAALDLSKRNRANRKIIFVISQGREYGSRASYKDVLKVLLEREAAVYGIAVEASAIPVYNKIEKLHVPGKLFGYSDILPKYAFATGGEIFTEFSRDAVEAAYAHATGEARNQYTLGYTTRITPSSSYREIEVRVDRPGLKISAKSGYYPLPPTAH
jgi:VWFA-related protein